MTRDEVIRMAREAGVYSGATEMVFSASLERFAALVAAAEREACAKVCEGISKDPWTKVGREHAPYMEATAKDCAETIRKRGEVKL